MVKAQVHAGGRGKAGGVKMAKSKDEVASIAESLLGTNLVTKQTTAAGQPINTVLVEAPLRDFQAVRPASARPTGLLSGP